jgi:circadian clock protein KaiC
VPGLDEVLGGGIPESSCTVIVGAAGTGKTTLANQMLFANAAAGRPGVYFVGPGESPDKLLRHQQLLSFFERDRLNRGVYMISLSQQVVEGDPNGVLETIKAEIERCQAAFVVVDLVQALTPAALWKDLVFYFSQSKLTSVLIADCEPLGQPPGALLSVADHVLWLRSSRTGDAALHTIEAPKARGQQPMPGLHHLRLSWDGMHVFPRWPIAEPRVPRPRPPRRLALDLDELDRMLGGGVPAGDAVLVEGESGTGKSVLATQFVVSNARRGEHGVVLLFEERPDRFIARAEALNLGLEELVEDGVVDVLSFRGRDQTADELMYEVARAVRRIGAQHLVIDSLAGLELVLTGGRGLRDCLWRLLDAQCSTGVTAWLCSEPGASVLSFVDDVISLARDEHEMRLRVLKMRSSGHCGEARCYEIGEGGVRLQPRELPKRRNGHVVGPELRVG